MLHLRKKKGKLEPHSEYEYGGKRNSVSQESNNRRPTRGEPLNQRVFSDRNTFTSITQSHKQRWQHYLYSAPHQETRLLHRQFIHRTLYQESQTILYTSFRLTSIFLIRQKYVANFVSDLKKKPLKIPQYKINSIRCDHDNYWHTVSSQNIRDNGRRKFMYTEQHRLT